MIMKKIVSVSMILAVAMAFNGCSGEEDDIFQNSAAERLNAASEIYSARLTAQPNGWAMQYYPTYDDSAPNGKGYLLLTRFNKDFTVDVSGYDWPYWRYERVGDAQNSSQEWVSHYYNEYREATSFWEVITDNGPVLSFNSYNANMHYFSDPDFRETGTGFGGDYEFIVVEAPEDASYMMLKGKKRGTYNLLTPIEEGIVYADYMADVKGFHNSIFPETELISNLVHFGDTVYRMDGSNDGLPNIYPYDGDAIANENFNPFLITKRGDDYYLRFRDAFERDDMEGSLQELRYVPADDQFVGVENEAFRITGFPPAWFFSQALQRGQRFLLTTSSQKSEKMAQLYDGMRSELSSKMNFTVTNFQIIASGAERDSLSAVINYRVRRGSTYVTGALTAAYSYSFDENSLTIGQPVIDANTSGRMEQSQMLADLFKSLAGTFRVQPAESAFNLSGLLLTRADDENFWFVITHSTN